MALKILQPTSIYPIVLNLEEDIQVLIQKANRGSYLAIPAHCYLVVIEIVENPVYVQLFTTDKEQLSDIFPQRGLQIQLLLPHEWASSNDFLVKTMITSAWMTQSIKLKEAVMLFVNKAAEFQQHRLAFFGAFYSLLSEIKNSIQVADALIPNDEEKVKEAAQYLANDFANHPPTVEELALKASMSLSKFKTLFKQIYGESPYQYHQRAKLAYAAELLTTGRYTVSQVSYKVGYSHSIKFIKIFEKYYGTTPGKYKQIINQ
jgi:AraC-like DNA-binding protein